MTVSIVQHFIDITSGTSPWTTAFTSNMTAGNLVCGFLTAGFQTPDPTITDPGTGDTYSITASAKDNVDGQSLWGFYKIGVAGSQTTLTFTSAANAAMSVELIELHSTTGWTGFRNSASGAASVVGLTATCSSSLGAAGDVIVAGAYTGGGSVSTAGGGLTLIDNQGTGGGTIACDSWLASASGAVTPAFTLPSNAGWVIWAMAFTPAPSTTAVFSDSVIAHEVGRIAQSDGVVIDEDSLAVRSGNERRRTIW